MTTISYSGIYKMRFLLEFRSFLRFDKSTLNVTKAIVKFSFFLLIYHPKKKIIKKKRRKTFLIELWLFVFLFSLFGFSQIVCRFCRIQIELLTRILVSFTSNAKVIWNCWNVSAIVPCTVIKMPYSEEWKEISRAPSSLVIHNAFSVADTDSQWVS